MNQSRLFIRVSGVAVAALLLLSACGAGAEQATPTLSVEQIQTEAVATFSADLTSTAQSMPTNTPTATETTSPTPTRTPGTTNTPSSVATAGANPTSTCYGLTFVSDVTIPDNTRMEPGQRFTKTWRVRNSGSCAWEAGFQFRFTGGEAMGGSSVALESAVQPGSETDLSVALTAPTTAGTHRGNWRMSTAAGTFFGDEVFVQIVVGSASASPTGSASATPAPTANPTLDPTGTAGIEEP